MPQRRVEQTRAHAGAPERLVDPQQVDLGAVHRYLSGESYWAKGRPRAEVERLVGEATRVVGIYHEGVQVGFCRAVSDRAAVAYVLTDHAYALSIVDFTNHPDRGNKHWFVLGTGVASWATWQVAVAIGVFVTPGPPSGSGTAKVPEEAW